MTQRCRTESCQAEIDWATSVPGPGGRPSRMPVNHDSAGDPAGNLAVWRDAGGRLRFRVLRKGEEPSAGQRRGVSHYATCVAADHWRRGLCDLRPTWLTWGYGALRGCPSHPRLDIIKVIEGDGPP